MKISPSAFDVFAALLAVGAVTAFVPTSCRIEHSNGHFSTHPRSQTSYLPASAASASSTAVYASASEVDADVEASASTTSSISFPFSDSQVRFAYDEWRLIYGKGDFDPDRFENFKMNHKTLTISNLKAREKSTLEGLPIPQWMSLNEYGDYSLDEYEAMMRGEGGESLTYDNNGYEAGATQANANYSNGQMQEYQDQFGRTIRSSESLNQDDSLASAASVDSNYANNIGDGDENSRGTLIIPKGEEDDNSQNQIPQSGTQAVGSYANSSGAAVRGTQVLIPGGGNGYDSASSFGSGRGTQVITPGGIGSRGTQVITPGGIGSRGTQVIGFNGSSGARGTQVIQSFSDPEPQENENEFQPTDTEDGTQFIPRNEGGTLIIPKSDIDNTVADADADAGTQFIPRNDVGGEEDAAAEGNDDSNNDSLSKLFGGIFAGSKNDEEGKGEVDDNNDDPARKRGTMVIKKSIEEPERKPLFGFFGSSSTDEEEEEEKIEIVEEPEPSNSNNFFGFLNSKDESSTTAETAPTVTEEEEESKTGSGSGIFSLFGGTIKSSNPRSVRTSISLQQQAPKGKTKKSPGFQSKRETKLIPDETESETGMPSILSFFGGAKKVNEEETARNPNSRPTLVVKKPKKFQWSFSAKKTEDSPVASTSSSQKPNDVIAAQIAKQKEGVERAARQKVEVAKEREAKRLEREEKRLAATQKREALARGGTGGTRAVTGKARGGSRAVTTQPKTKTTASSPFAFFGAIGKQAEPPTLAKWRQNRDGTITGLIYDSKSFEDGTRITTSPVPRGAKKGTLVKTDGGSTYSLT